jgi:undecaprenyl diphosphate synthase
MDFYNEKLELNVPEHIAIILDGNGRWAKKRLLPRNAGHLQGSRVLERICDDAIEIGLKYLTVYVFSTENWKRSESEVQGLMKILRNYLKTCIKRAREKNMKVVILGKQDMLDESGVLTNLRNQVKIIPDLYFKLHLTMVQGMKW